MTLMTQTATVLTQTAVAPYTWGVVLIIALFLVYGVATILVNVLMKICEDGFAYAMFYICLCVGLVSLFYSNN